MRDPLDDLIDKVRQVIDHAVKASPAVVEEELVPLGGHAFSIRPLAAGAAEIGVIVFRHSSLMSIGEHGAHMEIDVSSEPGVAALGRDLRAVMAGEVEVARGFASTLYFREGGKWVGGGEFSFWPRRFRRRRRYAPWGAV